MKAIRGATTIAQDTKEEIKEAVAELLNTLVKNNGLTETQMVYILFSTTQDIHAYYPAKAAREAGFAQTPLFSAVEPQINGALPLCIRVLVLADIDYAPKPVYLRGAASLRKDLTQKYAIAIDGPAGSGKSTVAKLIAKKLNILYLDTGAMYRTCALACLNGGVDIHNEQAVFQKIAKANIAVEYKNGGQVSLLEGIDVSDQIRTPAVSQAASVVSVYGAVREKLVSMQRTIASQMSCIIDGRDIGTTVLPNAPYKFFVTASCEERARRRYDENTAKGLNDSYEHILAEIMERDERDRTRAISPLRQADDAILIDTSNMEVEEVVDFIISKIQEKV